jgi:hypothetical protein
MRFAEWGPRLMACLGEKRFWKESINDAVWLIVGSSSGLGVALVTAVLNIGHRVMLTARDAVPS